MIMTNHALQRAKQRCGMTTEQANADSKTAIIANMDSFEYGDDNAKEVNGDVAKWVVMETEHGYVVITCKGYNITKRKFSFGEWATGRRRARRKRV